MSIYAYEKNARALLYGKWFIPAFELLFGDVDTIRLVDGRKETIKLIQSGYEGVQRRLSICNKK